MLRPPPPKAPEPVIVATPPPKKDIPESLIQATLRPPAPKKDADVSAKPQADSKIVKPEEAAMPRSTSPGTEITTQTDEEVHVAMLQSLSMHLCSEVTENVEAGTAAVAGLIEANDNTMKELEAQKLDKKTLSAQLDSLRSAFTVLNGECVAAVADAASARDELSKLKARLSSEEQARSSMKEEFEARLSSEEKARSSMKEEFEGKQNAMEKVSEARRNSHMLEVKEVSAARDSLAKQVEELNAKIKEMKSSVSSAGDQAAKDRDLSSAKDREVAKAVEELERVRSSIPKLIKEEAERLEKKHAEEMSKLKAGKGKDMAEAAEELEILKRSMPELIKEEAERLEKKHAEEINEVNTRHRELNQDLTKELAKARNAEVSMRGNVEKLEGQLGAMQCEMDDAKHRQARELEIAKQQSGEYMAKGAADALENSELKMKLVAEKDRASARLASEDKRVREAQAALKQAEGKVTKLEEALKQESDKVKRLEGLIASAPAGPSAELESELSDEMRRLLAEKVAMQALLGAKAQFEGDAAKKAQEELQDMRARCAELENTSNDAPSMGDTAVLRVVSSWIPPRDASPDDSSGVGGSTTGGMWLPAAPSAAASGASTASLPSIPVPAKLHTRPAPSTVGRSLFAIGETESEDDETGGHQRELVLQDTQQQLKDLQERNSHIQAALARSEAERARMHGVFDNAMREAVYDCSFLKGRNESLERVIAELTQEKEAAAESLGAVQKYEAEVKALEKERDAGNAMLDQRDKEVKGLLKSVQELKDAADALRAACTEHEKRADAAESLAKAKDGEDELKQKWEEGERARVVAVKEKEEAAKELAKVQKEREKLMREKEEEERRKKKEEEKREREEADAEDKRRKDDEKRRRREEDEKSEVARAHSDELKRKEAEWERKEAAASSRATALQESNKELEEAVEEGRSKIKAADAAAKNAESRVKKLEKTVAALEAACEELKLSKTADASKDAARNILGMESFLVSTVACMMLAVAALVWMGAGEAVAWRPLVAGIMSCPHRGWEGCSINIMTSITHPRLAIAYHTLGVDSNVEPDEAKAAHRALVGSSCAGCSNSELLRLAERKEGANQALELVMRVGRVREGAVDKDGRVAAEAAAKKKVEEEGKAKAARRRAEEEKAAAAAAAAAAATAAKKAEEERIAAEKAVEKAAEKKRRAEEERVAAEKAAAASRKAEEQRIAAERKLEEERIAAEKKKAADDKKKKKRNFKFRWGAWVS